jgi:hypothetical protein
MLVQAVSLPNFVFSFPLFSLLQGDEKLVSALLFALRMSCFCRLLCYFSSVLNVFLLLDNIRFLFALLDVS